MAGPVACKQDAIEWVNKLKENKINKFMFKSLPAELKIKELLHKASALKLIVKVRKTRGSIAEWRIAHYRSNQDG